MRGHKPEVDAIYWIYLKICINIKKIVTKWGGVHQARARLDPPTLEFEKNRKKDKI